MSAIFALYFVVLFTFCAAGPAFISLSPLVQELPQPYEFGFEFGNGLGMAQHRRETADVTGAVSGTYGYRDPLGVYRNVEYTANGDGYKANIRSNEPGLANQNTADAAYYVLPPPPAAVAQGLRFGLNVNSI